MAESDIIVMPLVTCMDWLTYAIMLDSLVVAHTQFMIMLIELLQVLSQEIKSVCAAKLPQPRCTETARAQTQPLI